MYVREEHWRVKTKKWNLRTTKKRARDKREVMCEKHWEEDSHRKRLSDTSLNDKFEVREERSLEKSVIYIYIFLGVCDD